MSDLESQEQDYETSSVNEEENESDIETDNNNTIDETNEGEIENEDTENDNYEEESIEDTNNNDLSSNKKNKTIKDINFIDDDEDDDDDDEDLNYLKKFNNNIIRNHLVEFHPETKTHNYIEIQAMTRVIRDIDGNIIDDLHKTIPFLTKYEKTRILGQRAKQIESGSIPFIKIPNNIIDSYVIAQMELKEKKIPFIIRRPLPNGGSEYWKLTDLQMIN